MKKLLKGPFLFLWIAQIFSQLAVNMVNFILIIFIYEKTFSNTAVSGLVISFTLPALFFGILAGAYVDRRNKKGILLLTNILRALLTVSFFFTKESLPLVFILSFLITTVTQFFVPAEASSIPRLVGKNLLISANSLFMITLNSSIFLGYILAGPVIKIFGFTNAFLVAGLFYLMAAFFVSLLPSLGKEKTVALNDFLRNDATTRIIIRIKEVYQLMKQAKNILFSVVFLTISQGIIVVLATLLPGYAKTVLGIETTDISLLILTPATLGMVLGSIVLARFAKKFSPQTLVNTGIILSGVILLVLPFLSRLTTPAGIFGIDIIQLAIAFVFLAGVANTLVVVVSNATIQAGTQREMVGRIYGIVMALTAAFSFFPVLLAGALADIFGVRTVLVIISIVVIILGLFKSYRDYKDYAF